jgi:hypothetical protein
MLVIKNEVTKRRVKSIEDAYTLQAAKQDGCLFRLVLAAVNSKDTITLIMNKEDKTELLENLKVAKTV